VCFGDELKVSVYFASHWITSRNRIVRLQVPTDMQHNLQGCESFDCNRQYMINAIAAGRVFINYPFP